MLDRAVVPSTSIFMSSLTPPPSTKKKRDDQGGNEVTQMLKNSDLEEDVEQVKGGRDPYAYEFFH